MRFYDYGDLNALSGDEGDPIVFTYDDSEEEEEDFSEFIDDEAIDHAEENDEFGLWYDKWVVNGEGEIHPPIEHNQVTADQKTRFIELDTKMTHKEGAVTDEEWAEYYRLHQVHNLVKIEERKNDLEERLLVLCRTTVPNMPLHLITTFPPPRNIQSNHLDPSITNMTTSSISTSTSTKMSTSYTDPIDLDAEPEIKITTTTTNSSITKTSSSTTTIPKTKTPKTKIPKTTPTPTKSPKTKIPKTTTTTTTTPTPTPTSGVTSEVTPPTLDGLSNGLPLRRTTTKPVHKHPLMREIAREKKNNEKLQHVPSLVPVPPSHTSDPASASTHAPASGRVTVTVPARTHASAPSRAHTNGLYKPGSLAPLPDDVISQIAGNIVGGRVTLETSENTTTTTAPKEEVETNSGHNNNSNNNNSTLRQTDNTDSNTKKDTATTTTTISTLDTATTTTTRTKTTNAAAETSTVVANGHSSTLPKPSKAREFVNSEKFGGENGVEGKERRTNFAKRPPTVRVEWGGEID